MEKELPKGWKETKLESVVDILDNKRKPVSAKVRTERVGDIPYYGATGQTGTIDDYIFNEELVLLGEDGAPFFDKKKNVAYLINGKSWVNNHAHVLKGKKELANNRYILNFLNQFDYTGYVGGTTRLKLNQSNLKKIPIPIPPLAEQKRIVVKLDALFGHLDNLKAKLDRIPTLLKNFRQSVLTQAVTGKLTEEWRVLGDWSTDTIENLSIRVGSGSTPKGGSNAYKAEGIPLIRSMNIHFNGIKKDGIVYIDDRQAEKLKNVIIEKDDVLLNITGASIGRVCLAEDFIEGARVNQHVSIIRTNNRLKSEYLNVYLSSPYIQDYINKENYGVTRQALTKSQLLNLDVKLPPLPEQKEIVKRVNQLFSVADSIESQYQSLKAKIDHLPQAILQKAFKGELVPQDPNDEPASVLLERIREEKEKIATKK